MPSSVMLIRGEHGNTAQLFVQTTPLKGASPAGRRGARVRAGRDGESADAGLGLADGWPGSARAPQQGPAGWSDHRASAGGCRNRSETEERFTGGNGFTRRHGVTETHGEVSRSIGRRRRPPERKERKYKPRCRDGGLYLRPLPFRQCTPSTANRTARPPCVSVPPCLRVNPWPPSVSDAHLSSRSAAAPGRRRARRPVRGRPRAADRADSARRRTATGRPATPVLQVVDPSTGPPTVPGPTSASSVSGV